MDLGEKIRLARLKAGLSQRQLCGDIITRNMLSQIEHGTANPSVATLQYLASRLSKPMSFFLEEDAVVSPNLPVMTAARDAFDRGDYEEAASALESYQVPDPVYDREKDLITACLLLKLAEQAMTDGRRQYALELLEKAEAIHPAYMTDALAADCLRLAGKLGKGDLGKICQALPSLDDDLLLRGQNALNAGNVNRAAQLLDAAEDHGNPRWNLLRGEIYQAHGAYTAAIVCYQQAEEAFPAECCSRMELCYRENGDFKMAYQYACKLRELNR